MYCPARDTKMQGVWLGFSDIRLAPSQCSSVQTLEFFKAESRFLFPSGMNEVSIRRHQLIL